MIGDTTQNGNDDFRCVQLPFFHHELTKSMEIDRSIDVEERSSLEQSEDRDEQRLETVNKGEKFPVSVESVQASYTTRKKGDLTDG